MVHVVQNALKFSPRGAPIHVAVREGDPLVFEVTDEGPGVDEEELGNIFEPFYQVDGSTTRVHNGVGLGLAFAVKVAQGVGGALHIESPPAGAEHGTFVRMTIPRGV